MGRVTVRRAVAVVAVGLAAGWTLARIQVGDGASGRPAAPSYCATHAGEPLCWPTNPATGYPVPPPGWSPPTSQPPPDALTCPANVLDCTGG
jgi:hypothetical protein